MSTSNRYAIDHTPALENVIILSPKYCELCGLPFVTSDINARFPGDALPLQRAAGKRLPIICKACRSNSVTAAFLLEETREVNRITSELRMERDTRIHLQVLEEQKLYQQRRVSAYEHKKDEPRRMRYARWREPLMKAFAEQGELTAKEIAAIVGCNLSDPTSIYMAVPRARQAGVPIVISRKIEYFNERCGAMRHRNLYTISSKPEEEALRLTPPQDTVTGQFMTEVH